MTDTEKIAQLKIILADPIAWYEKNIEERGEDYVYDELYQQIGDMSRGKILDLISTIIAK